MVSEKKRIAALQSFRAAAEMICKLAVIRARKNWQKLGTLHGSLWENEEFEEPRHL